jgi:hypothetical protein
MVEKISGKPACDELVSRRGVVIIVLRKTVPKIASIVQSGVIEIEYPLTSYFGGEPVVRGAVTRREIGAQVLGEARPGPEKIAEGHKWTSMHEIATGVEPRGPSV